MAVISTYGCAPAQGHTPVMGVVHVPVSGKTYFAVQGRGAYMKEASGEVTQIHAAEFSPADKELIIVASASHTNEATKEFIELFEEPRFKQYGSSLKMLLVAEGQAHIYPR